MKRLGINIDHIATLRNARGEAHPDPVYAAKFVKQNGADSVTIHLREDRRHINDLDAKKICLIKNLFVNLEVSTNLKIIKTPIFFWCPAKVASSWYHGTMAPWHHGADQAGGTTRTTKPQ